MEKINQAARVPAQMKIVFKCGKCKSKLVRDYGVARSATTIGCSGCGRVLVGKAKE